MTGPGKVTLFEVGIFAVNRFFRIRNVKCDPLASGNSYRRSRSEVMWKMVSLGVVCAVALELTGLPVQGAIPSSWWQRGVGSKSPSRTTFTNRSGRTVARSRTSGNRTRFTDRSGRSTATVRKQGNRSTMTDRSGRTVGRSVTSGQRTTFYDRSGRRTGTSRVSGNRTTFHDRSGRRTGYSRTTGGRTTIYDRTGRVVGRSRNSR